MKETLIILADEDSLKTHVAFNEHISNLNPK